MASPKTKKIQQVFNLLILDESGSMESIRTSIINSFNEVVQTIKAAENKSKTEEKLQEHFISLYAFNGAAIRQVYFIVPVSNVTELTTRTYCPNSGTPLFDAMGMALERHEQAIKGKKDPVTLVTILTDGEENMSREYNSNAIGALVKRLKETGWVFNYIGTNHNVEAFSAKISISASKQYDDTELNFGFTTEIEKNSRNRFYEKIKNLNYSPAEANEDYYKNDDDENN